METVDSKPKKRKTTQTDYTTVIDIGSEISRWRYLQEKLKLETDEDVAKVLLNWYEYSHNSDAHDLSENKPKKPKITIDEYFGQGVANDKHTRQDSANFAPCPDSAETGCYDKKMLDGNGDSVIMPYEIDRKKLLADRLSFVTNACSGNNCGETGESRSDGIQTSEQNLNQNHHGFTSVRTSGDADDSRVQKEETKSMVNCDDSDGLSEKRDTEQPYVEMPSQGSPVKALFTTELLEQQAKPSRRFRKKVSLEECIILEVQKHMELYDPSDLNYKNSEKRAEAWEDIGRKLHIPGEDCKNKWKNLRDTYVKKRRVLRTKAGTKEGEKIRRWKFFPIFTFLNPFIHERDIQSFVNIENDSSYGFSGSDDDAEEVIELDNESQSSLTLAGKRGIAAPTGLDDVDSLFFSLAQRVKGLPEHIQSEVKRKVCQVIEEAELASQIDPVMSEQLYLTGEMFSPEQQGMSSPTAVQEAVEGTFSQTYVKSEEQ